MKRINKYFALLLPAICTATGTFALSDSESASVLFMKQEEKLARDVYTHLSTIYELPVFANIARAEQRHMNSVDYLIASNDLQDSTPETAGLFTYPELTELYAQLIEKGEISLLDALEVGVLIEETDIEDLENEMLTAEDATLRSIYNNLLRGSYNHLKAFNNSIASGGTQPNTPNLNVNGTANNNLQVQASGGNGYGNASRGNNTNSAQTSNLTVQSRPADGSGPWKDVRGNGNGVGVNPAGNGSAPLDMAVNRPAQATLYRARANDGTQASYSNELCSQLVGTPWPNGAFVSQGWYTTWMGDLFIPKYPLVYSARHGWITVESFADGELWFVDENNHRWMTTEERYPWVYSPETDTWI